MHAMYVSPEEAFSNQLAVDFWLSILLVTEKFSCNLSFKLHYNLFVNNSVNSLLCCYTVTSNVAVCPL